MYIYNAYITNTSPRTVMEMKWRPTVMAPGKRSGYLTSSNSNSNSIKVIVPEFGATSCQAHTGRPVVSADGVLVSVPQGPCTA